MFFKLLSALENYNISRPKGKGELKRMTQEILKIREKKRKKSTKFIRFVFLLRNRKFRNFNIVK
jgi:hypothetical protein